MILQQVFDRFAKKTPVGVMVRATLANVLSAERLDKIFEDNALRQRTHELAFSTVADLLGQVVCRIHPSVNAAYLDRKKEIGVTAKSVYDKLQGTEPHVARALIRETAARMRAIIDKMGKVPGPLVPGYRTKILDGNHLRRTDRRIGELRELNAAPLPGQALVVFDPQYRLVIDVIPCEDGHAQERSLLPELLETVGPNDLWIADRNFCTVAFLAGIAKCGGKFAIRQHGGLSFTPIGNRERVGSTDTGVVYEQRMKVANVDGTVRVYRRITVVLNGTTRDGDAELHIVSNLPARISAIRIAGLYRGRWQIETAFQEVAENLESEIKTLGYPKAALFGFAMGMVTYNLLSVVRAAVRAVHGEAAAEKLSTYYVSNEVAAVHFGMSVVLDAAFWQQNYGHLTPRQMADELASLARNMRLSKYTKNKWKPKPPTKKLNKTNRNHISTARVLHESRGSRASVT